MADGAAFISDVSRLYMVTRFIVGFGSMAHVRKYWSACQGMVEYDIVQLEAELVSLLGLIARVSARVSYDSVSSLGRCPGQL